jgi:DNA repair exonuclease SbcCD ATPase subunit
MIIPIKLKIKNFLSYEKQTFNFNSNGTYLITGINLDDSNSPSNGTGKTSLIEALIFCLTGKTFKGLKGDDVIRDGEKSCSIEFYFLNNNKKGYIKVKRKPNGLEFHDGNNEIKESSQSLLQNKIQEFFGADFELLTKFIFVGENEKNKFSFLNSDDSEKKKLLTKITKSEMIDEAYEKNEINIQSKKEEVYKLENKIESLNESIESLNKSKINIKLNIKDLEGEKYEIDEKLIKELKIKELNLIKIKEELNLLKSKEFIFNEKIEKRKQLFYDIEKEFNFIEKKKLYEELNLSKNTSDKCPKCGFSKNGYDDKKIKEIEKIIEGYKNKLESIELKKEEKKFIFEVETLEKRLKHIKEETFKVEGIKENLENFISDSKFKIKIEENNKKNKIENVKNDLKRIIKEKKKTIRQIQENSDILNSLKDELNIMIKFKFFFGKEGFKNYLFGKKLRIIESAVCEILKQTNSKIEVKLNGMTKLKSGKYNQKIGADVFIRGEKRNFTKLSKGQMRRIDLAFILAFGKLLNFKNPINIRTFDEPFGGLDNKGKENIINMFKSINIPTYILSPENELKKYFDSENIIQVVYKNNISSIRNN